MPMPSKRTSVMATSPKHKESRRMSDSSSDEDSILHDESSSTASERERSRRNVRRPFSIDHSMANSSDTSTHSSPAHERNYHYRIQQSQPLQPALPPRIIGVHEHGVNLKNTGISNMPDLTKFNQGRKLQIQLQPLPQPPFSKISTPQPPNLNQSHLLRQYQMNLPSPNRMNGSQSHQVPITEYINELPPDRPERISSRSADNNINHLADVLQNMPPLSNTFNVQPDITNTQSNSQIAELQIVGKL